MSEEKDNVYKVDIITEASDLSQVLNQRADEGYFLDRIEQNSGKMLVITMQAQMPLMHDGIIPIEMGDGIQFPV